jgi:hypothetical protein
LLMGVTAVMPLVVKAGSALKPTAGAVLAEAEAATLAALDKAAQKALIRSGGVIDANGNAMLDMKSLTTAQKGVVGELFGPATVQKIVPDGQQIARIPAVGENGIDALYKVSRPDVDYVSIEYKFVGTDSKTGAQVLGKTQDGLQGSQGWVTGNGRIETAVGRGHAPSVELAVRQGRLESWVVTTRPDGSTEIQVLDAFGKPKPIDTSKIILPKTNPSEVKP